MRKAPAYEVEIGSSFFWKNETYVVIKDYDSISDGDALVVARVSKQQENFNPYCIVEVKDA